MQTITDRDVRAQVEAAVTANGFRLAEGIDVDAVTAEVIERRGLVNIDEIGHDIFWDIVWRHDTTQH